MNSHFLKISLLLTTLLLPVQTHGESNSQAQKSRVSAAPHIFNADSPVLLIQETEFFTTPYSHHDGEVGSEMVIGKALGGIGTDIAPGSVVILTTQGASELPFGHRNGRRLFLAQVTPSLVRPLHPSGHVYCVAGEDFTCFNASWLLKMNPDELKPEWRHLQQQVDSLLNPAIPTAEDLQHQPAAGSPEQLLFEACTKRQGTAGSLGVPVHILSPEVHALIASGADVNARCNDRGMTPLMQAALHNDSVACRLLLNAGANPNLRDINGMTALNYALIGKDLPTAQLDAFRSLLPWGTRIDMRCTPPQGTAYKGATPLHHSVLLNSRNNVWELLRKGADSSAIDAAGRTPLDLARELHRAELIPLLKTAQNKQTKKTF